MYPPVKIYIRLILAICVLFIISASSAKADSFSTKLNDTIAEQLEQLEKSIYDEDSIASLFHYWSTVNEFPTLMRFGHQWLEEAETNNNSTVMLLCYAYVGQAEVFKDNYEKGVALLNKGKELLSRIPYRDRDVYYYNSLYVIYNGFGMYYVNAEMDYLKAVRYFLEGFNISDKRGDERQFIVFGLNIVMTYFLREDPSGLKYAQQIYDRGQSEKNEYTIFCGAYILSFMYEIMNDYQNALKFSREAIGLMDPDYPDKAKVFVQYANALRYTGDIASAYEYYEKAIAATDKVYSSTTTYVYYCYANFLMDQHRYQESITMSKTGIDISLKAHNTLNRYKLYGNLSDAYRALGDYKSALDYFVIYKNESDSVFNIERERSINEMRAKYETEKQEREIEQGKVALMKQGKRLQTVLFLLVIIVIAAAAIYILYRHKNKLYIKLLRQHQEALKHERQLSQQINALRAANTVAESANSDSDNSEGDEAIHTSDTKHQDLFVKLEQLMMDEKIYRQKDMTVEKVAKMINTNRTYLSKTINYQTGLSFNYYINSYRIEEAVRMLSDKENDTLIKTLAYDLGFKSLSTFYKLFQSVTGMTPSEFRENVNSKKPE